MGTRDEKDNLDADTRRLLRDVEVPADDPEFSLEAILSEYGRGLIPPDAPEEQPDEPETVPPPRAREETVRPSAAPAKEPEPEPEMPKREQTPAEMPGVPRPPRPVSMEEIVGRTVESVLAQEEEEDDEIHDRPPRRRFLFSRRPIPEDTEELPPPPEPEPERSEEPEPEEPSLVEAANVYKAIHRRCRRPILPAAALALLLALPELLEGAGISLAFWQTDVLLRSLVQLAGTAICCVLGRNVFREAFAALRRRHFTAELLVCAACLVTLADCLRRALSPADLPGGVFAPVACAAMAFALWGQEREARGRYDSYRTAAMDPEPPYLVTDTPEGACKQAGAVAGFFNDTEKVSTVSRRQGVVLPVIFTAAVAFSLLASVGQQRPEDLLWCASAIFCGAATFTLCLSDKLPYAKLSRRLQKNGAAVAGYVGAERIGKRKTMVLTDADLFPPGTVTLNGIKLFAEEMGKAVSYAAGMARASGSGLTRLFDALLTSEGGRAAKVEDFSFYEEGGVSGTIRGETVLMGTASFMRKMDVRLPGGLNLKTGVYLAVDRQLIAVFAVKYLVSENVEWALRSLRRGHVTPILCSRDGNITPALVKRKFGSSVRMEYPALSDRLALSEQTEAQGRPGALLFREGLMPYAEAVTGGRRYCRAAGRCSVLSLLGSAAGTLLGFYLSFVGAYTLLTPVNLLVFSLLWLLASLLLSDAVDRF